MWNTRVMVPKAIFYYIADDRVDFRELIKVLADQLKVRIEMKQIGARQEAGRIGGIGSCGRELVLFHLDHQFCFGNNQCCPVPGSIIESAKTGRSMRKIEMLSEL